MKKILFNLIAGCILSLSLATHLPAADFKKADEFLKNVQYDR